MVGWLYLRNDLGSDGLRSRFRFLFVLKDGVFETEPTIKVHDEFARIDYSFLQINHDLVLVLSGDRIFLD